MADNDHTKTSPADEAATGLKSDNVLKESRSLDIGASGQHAPGGYYNQQGATQTDRIDLDEQFPDASDEKS
jgi:hypothetical protein